MRLVAYMAAATIAGLGLLFAIAAAQGNTVARLAVGLVCIAVAVVLTAVVRMQPVQITRHVKVDLSGDVSLQELHCKQCGAQVGEKSVRIEAGAVFVSCEFCGAQYQLEEAPKW